MTNKDLIRQYVDTGLVIPEYQLAKLSSNDKKTYIRKRLIGVDGVYNFLEPYELPYMPIDNKKKYLRDLIKHELVWGPDISGDIKKLTHDFSESDKFEILSYMFELEEKNGEMGYEYFSLYKEFPELIKEIVKSGVNMTEETFNELPGSYKNTYLINNINKYGGDNVEDYVRDLAVKLKINDSNITNSIIFLLLDIGDDGVKHLLNSLSEETIARIFSNVNRITDEELLSPLGRDMTIKYGGLTEDIPTFDEVFKQIKAEGNYYGDDDTPNEGKFIDFDYIDEPLPSWAEKAGYFYNDSNGNEVFGLTIYEALGLARENMPKIFKLKY